MGDYSNGAYTYYRRMGGVDSNITNPTVDWYYPNQYSEFDPGVNSTGTAHKLENIIDDIENSEGESECSFDSTVYDPFNINRAGPGV